MLFRSAPQEEIGEGVIEQEIRVGDEKQTKWHVVESPGFEGVLTTENIVEIMRPEIITLPRHNKDPRVGLCCEPLCPGNGPVFTRKQQREDNRRQTND